MQKVATHPGDECLATTEAKRRPQRPGDVGFGRTEVKRRPKHPGDNVIKLAKFTHDFKHLNV